MATLYVIATPIGNLEDISLRALRILKEVDLIACEDTRTTKKLLTHYNIHTPTISYFQHSRLRKIDYILDQLKKNKDIALVSEAGTPCISDPGTKLIGYLISQSLNLSISPVPGPSALITAASVSGLPVDKFVFMGFPPHKKRRKKYFQEMVSSKYTAIFYESPYRILKSLRDLSAESNADKYAETTLKSASALNRRLDQRRFSGKRIVVCRELTKKFETIYRGTIEEVIEQIKRDKVKGEFVVIVEADKRR